MEQFFTILSPILPVVDSNYCANCIIMSDLQHLKQILSTEKVRIDIYIIRGTHNFWYCGISRNIKKRIKQHQQGECISTRSFRPFEIKLLQKTDSLQKALFIEKMIKQKGVEAYYNSAKYGFEFEKVREEYKELFETNQQQQRDISQ